MRTGEAQTLVRPGWADFDTYGRGYWCAATGNLDAVDFMPQGSIRVHNTGRPNPVPSIAHRDWAAGCMPRGTLHDGPEAATRWLLGCEALYQTVQGAQHGND